MVDKIIDTIAFMAGALVIPVIVGLIWGNWLIVFSIFIGLVIAGAISSAFKGSNTSSDTSTSNPVEGVYQVASQENGGPFTYKHYHISKKP